MMAGDQIKKELPHDWKWYKLSEVTNNLDGKRVPLSKPVRATRKGDFRYYGATEVVDYIDDYIFDGTYILIGEDGANLLSRSRPLSFIAEGKFWVNNHAHVLEATEQLEIKFLNYYFNSLNIAEYVTGTAQPKLTQANLNKIPVPIAPKRLQRKIVSKVEELFSELDKSIGELKTVQKEVKVYRQAVLKWAFEGRLTNDAVKEGEMPEGWRWLKLKEIALKVTDGEHATPRRTPDGVLLLSARNIHNGQLHLSNVDYVPEEEYLRIIKRCNPEENDILISCSGSVGRVCKVPKNLKFVMVRSVALVKLDWKKYSSKFYEYLFQSPLLQKQIEKGKKATAQANLFLGPINNLEVLKCPLETQEAIVQEIESRLSVCDKIEETITTSLQQAEALRQSILKQAFEGKLVSEK
jgi:type I restriction enzyme, S subunit